MDILQACLCAGLLTATVSMNVDPLLESIGCKMCPICIIDFEDSDDMQVLPCESKHVFHQRCMDP